MPAPAYATGPDLADWLDIEFVPDNAVRALRTAARLVRQATVTARYDATPAGIPTDATLAAAMKAATCIQAGAIITAGIDPDGGGISDATVESSSGIGSARVTVAGADQAAAARAALTTRLCVDAWLELRQAGLA